MAPIATDGRFLPFARLFGLAWPVFPDQVIHSSMRTREVLRLSAVFQDLGAAMRSFISAIVVTAAFALGSAAASAGPCQGGTDPGPHADCHGADLHGANLQGADLTWANLKRANLAGANLQGAGLMDANLRNADLRGANTRGANFKGAWLNGMLLPDGSPCVSKMRGKCDPPR
jgi:hypothetical protein